MKKLFIKTYGCQMNAYDSSKMADILHASNQLELADSPEEADVILVNTCSVREKAEDKMRSELGRYHVLKKKRPDLIIGVGGCVASQEGEAILKMAPYVDLVFGPQTVHRLPEMIQQVRHEHRSVVDISFPEIEKFDHLPTPRADGPSAYVSIMEGCSKYCSYCIVPYTRGEEISRPFDDVLAEIVELTEQGVREIHLLGQNVNDYRGMMHTGEIADLAFLIHHIAAIDSLARIRFTTSHPTAFSDNLIAAYAEVPKLANHLHLPIQSGSDKILTAMKRNYTVLEYKSKIRKLRQVRPDISISSDFIVGFPGETDQDFEETMNLIHEIGFDHSYSFIYSKRPGTPAALLPDNVSAQVKKERLALLQNRINLNAANISQQMVNTLQTVLVTGSSKKSDHYLSGRTENNRVVNFSGNKRLIGTLIDIKITEALPNSLRGEIIVND
jgi:tRNA-2-methylthio-N6-dimethylallyladenosine synthase